MTITKIELLSDEATPAPIGYATVEVYDLSGVFQAGGISDENGEVQFLLPDASYYIYLYKPEVAFLPSIPQTIDVLGPSTNVFQVIGHVRELPESYDSLKCTVSGKILGVDGNPTRTRLIFEPVKDLLVLSSNVIAPSSRIEVMADEDGYYEFELLRNTKYNSYFLFPQDLFGTQPGKLDVITPDLPSVRLHNFLFPIPLSLTFSSDTLSLSVGGDNDESITVTAAFSDGTSRAVVSTPWAGLTVSSSDTTIADVSISDTKLIVKPLSAGTTTVTTTREVPTKVLIDPLPDFVSGTIVITVS